MAPTPDDWYRQGKEALAQERWQEAEAALWHCLAVQPRHGAALHLLGQLRRQQGRIEDAIRLQGHSVSGDPRMGWNAFALAELLEERRDWPEAASAMALAAETLPQHSWIASYRNRLQGLAALDGERLAAGMGPASYRYWCTRLEPSLPWQEPDVLPPGWLLLKAPDARLRPGALAWIGAELARRDAAGEPPPDGLYADEDLLAADGQRLSPWFKPGWQPEAFWSTPWLEAFSVWRLEWLHGVGLPMPPASPLARLAWQLQAVEARPCLQALPRILVHRTQLADPAGTEVQDRADLLLGHLRRCGEAVLAVTSLIPAQRPWAGGFRISWALPPTPPLVSVIVPSRDRPDLLASCLDGLLRSQSPRLALELWVADNGSRLQATAELRRLWSERPGLRANWLDVDCPFNWSRINNTAAQQARGDLLLFLNNDVRPRLASEHDDRWLESLAAQALRPVVGAAGALLLTPEGRLQHAGVLPGLGVDGCAHPYRHLEPDHDVHRGRSAFLTAWPALTGACLMLRRRLFFEAGGFDPALPVEGNDVDFGLRLGSLGFRQVLTPEAVLFHAEGASRGDDQVVRRQGLDYLRSRWARAMGESGPFWPAACSKLYVDGRPRELEIPDWE